MRFLLFALALLAPLSARAASLPPVPEPAVSALLHQVARMKCGHLSRQAGREVLTNRCNRCVIFSIQRMRKGGISPERRQFPVPAQGHTQLPFRDRGSTRLLAEGPCRGASGGPVEQLTAAKDKCISFRRDPRHGTLIFNTCGSCREVEIERIYRNGDRRRSLYSINGQSYHPFDPEGAKDAEILKDWACN